MTIAAIFVQEGGSYYGLDGVDPWPESRDARKYNGPHPVVAHPPCNLWCRMAKANYVRAGGEHNRPGNDKGCFASALSSVRLFGGVLEHPASTSAWKRYGLTRPVKGKWIQSGDGWVCEVWQSAYGHKANKATWLYYVGRRAPFDLDWARPIGTHAVGESKVKPVLTRKESSRTPELFRDELIKLAKWSLGE